MAKKEKNTEEQIFQAACRVFRKKGFDGARMQDIAEEAEINRSMLHYYFRNKDKLFQEVYQQQMIRFFPVIIELLGADMPIDEKVQHLVDAYYSFLDDNPKLANFILHEMNQNPERFKTFVQKQGIYPPKKFSEQIAHEIEQENMIAVDPRQLLVSIISLTLFPFVAQTMVQSLFKMQDDELQTFLQDRKEFVVDFILNAINYKRQ